MLQLCSNTQRQGVPMDPVWVPHQPISCTTEDFLAIVTPAAITGLLADYAGVGEVN